MSDANRGKQIVRDMFIEPYMKKSSRYIGIELEYPLIPVDRGDMRLACSGFLEYMVEKHGFTEEIRGYDGLLVGVKSEDGDRISADYHYAMTEFSMWRGVSLIDIGHRFNTLLKIASKYFSEVGFVLSGMGSNPKADFNNIPFTDGDFGRLVKEYMTNHTYYKNPSYFFYNMFSTQTHIDTPYEVLIESINLMQRLDFVRGILFSNSLPNPLTLPAGKAYPKNTLCSRDFNWKYSDFPSIKCYDGKFESIDDLVNYIAELEIFADKREGKTFAIDKISIKDYFMDTRRPESNFYLFRMFTNVALNHYGSLEIRGDCTQPISEGFAPSAFTLGLTANLDAAIEVTERFFKDNNISMPNSVLREKAITGQKITEDIVLKNFLKGLYDISFQGLLNRGYGEEVLINCLEGRIENLKCPAETMLDNLSSGMTIDELIDIYGVGEGVVL